MVKHNSLDDNDGSAWDDIDRGMDDGYAEHDDIDDIGNNGGYPGSLGSGIVSFTPPSNLSDGMNVNANTLHVGTPAGDFTDQLNFILQSNSVIGGILQNVSLGQVALVIGTQAMDPDTNASTAAAGYPTYQINFNSLYATAQGWTSNMQVTTDGYDMSLILGLLASGSITQGMAETLFLAKTMLHEAFHLKHWNNWQSALTHVGLQAGANPSQAQMAEAQQWLINNGYSSAQAAMFGTASMGPNGVEFTPSWGVPSSNPDYTTLYDQLSHEYLVNFEQDIFDKAIMETLDELLDLKAVKEGMEQALEFYDQNRQSYDPEYEPNWDALYNQQNAAYQDFMHQYDYLFN